MIDENPLRSPHLRKPSTSESDEEYSPFANGRVGTRPQLTITFRKVTGACHAFSYSHLYSLTADVENAGFIAEFTQHRVFVEGRNLAQLFRYASEHRVHIIQETGDRQALALDENHPIVERILVVQIGNSPL